MEKKNIKDINLKGKKVFLRVDYNVPMDENQNITNTKRIDATLDTLKYLLEQGAAVIIGCHLGRPTEAREPKFSTKPIAAKLAEQYEKIIGKKIEVKWAEDCIGEPAEKAAAALQPGEVLLLENLRYHKEEKKNNSVWLIVRTLPMSELLIFLKLRQVSSWKKKLTTSAKLLRILLVRLSELSAAQKFLIKSALSTT